MQPCRDYMTRTCERTNCKFLHDDTLCKHFYKGNCRFGEKCRKSHDFDVPRRTQQKKHHRKKKNTESFEPDHSPPDMRIMIGLNKDTYPQLTEGRDVILLPGLFEDESMYENLLKEMKECGFEEDKLWKLWHGDSHMIADDKLGNWKEKCPTFMSVVNKMRDYFGMDIKATRFNWYKDNQDWKPYHRDAAAIDERKAKTQNFTVGVTFGATRTASFQHMKTKTRIDFPLTNGSVYAFAKQVNIDWMHGIIQEPEEKKEGRISIICWGKNDQKEDLEKS